jgi:hypothetical protein
MRIWVFYALLSVYPALSEIPVSTHDGVRSFRAELMASFDVCTFRNQELHNLEMTFLSDQVEDGVSVLL